MSEKTIIEYEPGYASGGRKNWAKLVTSVDDSGKGGYAFEGEFLRKGENALPVGGIVITVENTGSAKNGEKEVEVWRVASDSRELIPVNGRTYNLRTQLESLKAVVREKIAEVEEPNPFDEAWSQEEARRKAEQASGNPLEAFSKKELIAEIERREALEAQPRG